MWLCDWASSSRAGPAPVKVVSKPFLFADRLIMSFASSWVASWWGKQTVTSVLIALLMRNGVLATIVEFDDFVKEIAVVTFILRDMSPVPRPQTAH